MSFKDAIKQLLAGKPALFAEAVEAALLEKAQNAIEQKFIEVGNDLMEMTPGHVAMVAGALAGKSVINSPVTKTPKGQPKAAIRKATKKVNDPKDYDDVSDFDVNDSPYNKDNGYSQYGQAFDYNANAVNINSKVIYDDRKNLKKKTPVGKFEDGSMGSQGIGFESQDAGDDQLDEIKIERYTNTGVRPKERTEAQKAADQKRSDDAAKARKAKLERKNAQRKAKWNT